MQLFPEMETLKRMKFRFDKVKRKKRTRKNGVFVEDDFSKELKKQGDDGMILRRLYLCQPMVHYMNRVNDESL